MTHFQQSMADLDVAPDVPAPLPQPASVLLTVEETAAALRIGRTKVYELLKGGDLGSVTIGRRRLVPMREVHRFADDLLASSEAA